MTNQKIKTNAHEPLQLTAKQKARIEALKIIGRSVESKCSVFDAEALAEYIIDGLGKSENENIS